MRLPEPTAASTRKAPLLWKVFGFAGAVALLTVAVFPSLVEGSSRSALRDVVRLCLANYSLTGTGFPCLAVNLDGGAEKGWVVFRPPVGRPDTILVPTLPIVGGEDPWLQNPETPNFFAAAWNARAAFEDDGGVPLTAGDGAVAVNSKFARTQDQLHLHIGCLAEGVRSNLRAIAAKLATGVWTRVDQDGPLGRNTWVLRTGSVDAAAVAPFRRVSEIAPGADKMGRMMIALAATPIQGRDELFVIAAESDTRLAPDAEDVVESRCARLSRGVTAR